MEPARSTVLCDYVAAARGSFGALGVPPDMQLRESKVPAGLRDALEAITRDYCGSDVSQHEAEIERLRRRYNHSISLVEAVDDATPGHGQYTCFMHAIGLRTPPALTVKIMRRFDHVYPGAEFVRVLIDVGLLKAARGRPENDHVVLYFSGETPRHAGKWDEGLVVSKWGLGHLWRHPVFEVPASYGDEIKIFEEVDGTAAAAWFVKYATQKLGAARILQLGDADA